MITFTITNKQRATATIVMIVSFAGHQYRKSIGIGVPTALWNAKKHCARVTSDYDGSIVNQRIEQYENAANATIKHFVSKRIIPRNDEFFEYFNAIIYPHEDTLSFTGYIANTYIPRYCNTRAERTIKIQTTILHKLQQYESEKRKVLHFSDVDMAFYADLQRWFYANGYNDTYFGTAIKVIKQCYTEAREVDKLHKGTATDHRDFTAIARPADAVYLTQDEIKAIEALDLSPSALCYGDSQRDRRNADERSASYIACRNLFIIGCYTGLRVSDFRRLDKYHFDGQFIKIKTKKTKSDIVVPVHPSVKKIIDSGFDFAHPISEQKINAHIKDICRLAGITQDIVINVNRAGVMIEEVHPKYELITNHTARRSFATNAIRAGVPTHAVMMILGHSSEATTMRYIKQSAQENADDVASHPFFQ